MYESKTKLYRVWENMKTRCLNKNNPGYSYYGARGISISADWVNSFKAFKDWAMANGYKEGLSIDRIDNNGNYADHNCRWVTNEIQRRNTRVIRKNNKSGFRGVCWFKKTSKWQSGIVVNKKRIHIGYYTDKKDAAIAYNNYIESNNLEHSKNVV